MDLLAGSCFFIDLERHSNGAEMWLEANLTSRILTSVITYSALAAGIESRSKLEELLAGIPILPINLGCAWIAGKTARILLRQGRTIGANELWIAAIALQAELPVFN